jgi:hypothetical protein
MKVLGVGYGRTGTSSLYEALTILGFKSIHYDRERLNDILDGSNPNPDFRRYDDVDAVTDSPSCHFYRELLEAYPDCKAILTIRNEDDWWRSMKHHMTRHHPLRQPSRWSAIANKLRIRTRSGKSRDAYKRFHAQVIACTFGPLVPQEFLYRKRFREHNQRVIAEVPSERLLVMDITAGEGWEKLCPFLGVPIPSEPFPVANKTNWKAFADDFDSRSMESQERHAWRSPTSNRGRVKIEKMTTP